MIILSKVLKESNQFKLLAIKVAAKRTLDNALLLIRCTKEELKQLQALAKECGISLSRYVVETGLKHRPRMRLTKDEVDALNSLAIARTDLIKISNVLSKKTAEEKARFFKNEKFMRWWIDAVAGLIQHWYSIEENIATNVQTQSKEQL